MIRLPKEETKALVALHGWSAIILGFLLYAVVATGTVAVLAVEIRHWSIGHIKQGDPLSGHIDATIRELSRSVDPAFLEEVSLSPSSRGNLNIFFHMHRTQDNGQVEEYGVQYEIDPLNQQVLNKQAGTGLSLFFNDPYNALSRFLVNIHTELHIPQPWGLLLTGILGLAMLVAAVSGFMMHRHLIADSFILRKGRSKTTVKRDAHTVAGTWSLPFSFILAFTGCFFSFTGSFGIPAMAMVAFGGDQETLIRTVIGAPKQEPGAVSNMVNIEEIMQASFERTQQHAESLSISDYGRERAVVKLIIPPTESDLAPTEVHYSGLSGEFIREKPRIGLQPSIGDAAVSIIAPLHFGNFAGFLSKAIWTALGFACCYVIVSGFTLWLKRREDTEKWNVFDRYVTIFTLGTPLAMLVCSSGYFVAMLLNANSNVVVPMSFCVASGLCLASGLVIKTIRTLKLWMLAGIAGLCLVLPGLRLLAGGPTWFEAFSMFNSSVFLVDSLLLILSAYCSYEFFAEKRSLTSNSDEQTESAAESPDESQVRSA